MKIKIDQWLNAIKIAINVGQSLGLGKVSKGLEKADGAVEITKAVKKMLKGKNK